MSVSDPVRRPIDANTSGAATAAAHAAASRRAARWATFEADRDAATATTAAISAMVVQGSRATAGISPSTYARAMTTTVGFERVRPVGKVSRACTSGPRWA